MTDDWVLVPREPTAAMYDSAARAMHKAVNILDDRTEAIYRAMIEAAPKPPVSIPTNATHAITTVAVDANYPPAPKPLCWIMRYPNGDFSSCLFKTKPEPTADSAPFPLYAAPVAKPESGPRCAHGIEICYDCNPNADPFADMKAESVAQSDAERDAEIARLREALHQILLSGTERNVKYTGMSTADIARAALDAGHGKGGGDES